MLTCLWFKTHHSSPLWRPQHFSNMRMCFRSCFQTLERANSPNSTWVSDSRVWIKILKDEIYPFPICDLVWGTDHYPWGIIVLIYCKVCRSAEHLLRASQSVDSHFSRVTRDKSNSQIIYWGCCFQTHLQWIRIRRRMHTSTKEKLGDDDNKSLINECCNEESSSIQELVGFEWIVISIWWSLSKCLRNNPMRRGAPEERNRLNLQLRERPLYW